MKKIITLLLLLPLLAQAQYSGPIYKPGSVAITGGSINGTTVGATTPTTGAFTTVTATKASAGASLTWTNGGATPKTGYLYSGANGVGFFDDPAGGGNGFYIYTGTHAYTQIGGSNIVDVTSTGAAVTGRVSGTTLVVTASASPASGAACTTGSIVWDASFIYVCTASGVWKRAALTGGY